MPIKSVVVDTRELEKAFKKISRRLPAVTAKAINETATFAKTNAQRETAKELKVPLKLVRKRLDVKGNVKGDRSKIKRAYRNRLVATLGGYMPGTPIGQIDTKPTNII